MSKPGQILRPEPNGISSKSCPLKSIELPRNLSGLNSFGFSQASESLSTAHAFTETKVLAGISYPSILHFSVVSLGTSSGAVGCNLIVSFTTSLR
uniref:Uncharacterized protein n=1 Tax=Salix viminalis TaxID=40686 RepID=A0A6N2MR56_SALVM